MLRSKQPQGQVPGQRFIDPGVLTRIDNLELIARGVVDGFISGLHRSPALGMSVDFAEHRSYMPGDDVRRVDWRLFARTDRLYVKEAFVDGGPVLKRIWFTTMGRAYRKLKRQSHVTIKLDTRAEADENGGRR